MGAVGLYLRVAWAACRRQATYRAAMAAGVFTNSVFGFVKAETILAVAAVRPSIDGFDGRDLVTMAFVGQGLLLVVHAFSDRELGERVRTGEIAVDVARPVDLVAWWLAVLFGRSACNVVFRGVPPMLVGMAVFGLRFPPGIGTAAWFAVSIAMAALLAGAFWVCVNLSVFWLLDVKGVTAIASLVFTFASGVLTPLQLLPTGLADVLRVLPPAHMVQLPTELFVGKLTMSPGALVASQLAWLVVLVALAQVLATAGTRKLVVQGG